MYPINLTGNPQSITLVDKLYDEASILAATKVFQDKTEHHKQHPERFKN
ncbi:MAG TPA: hypothetical protein VIZ28_19485 [Chitinophagaceae bacterium]